MEGRIRSREKQPVTFNTRHGDFSLSSRPLPAPPPSPRTAGTQRPPPPAAGTAPVRPLAPRSAPPALLSLAAARSDAAPAGGGAVAAVPGGGGAMVRAAPAPARPGTERGPGGSRARLCLRHRTGAQRPFGFCRQRPAFCGVTAGASRPRPGQGGAGTLFRQEKSS